MGMWLRETQASKMPLSSAIKSSRSPCNSSSKTSKKKGSRIVGCSSQQKHPKITSHTFVPQNWCGLLSQYPYHQVDGIFTAYIPTCCSWWSFFQRHVEHCHIFSALLEVCFQPSNLLTKRKRAMVPTKPTNWVANVPEVGSGVPRRMVTSHHLENKFSLSIGLWSALNFHLFTTKQLHFCLETMLSLPLILVKGGIDDFPTCSLLFLINSKANDFPKSKVPYTDHLFPKCSMHEYLPTFTINSIQM